MDTRTAKDESWPKRRTGDAVQPSSLMRNSTKARQANKELVEGSRTNAARCRPALLADGEVVAAGCRARGSIPAQASHKTHCIELRIE